MPIYEYVCEDCRRPFEKLVKRWGDAVDCPACGSGSVEKQLSTFAVSASSSSSEASGCGASACGQGACGSGACGLPN